MCSVCYRGSKESHQCDTANRIVVYVGIGARDPRIVCPTTDSSSHKQKIVEVFSGKTLLVWSCFRVWIYGIGNMIQVSSQILIAATGCKTVPWYRNTVTLVSPNTFRIEYDKRTGRWEESSKYGRTATSLLTYAVRLSLLKLEWRCQYPVRKLSSSEKDYMPCAKRVVTSTIVAGYKPIIRLTLSP